MPTYTSETTIGVSNPSPYSDTRPTEKKFWMTVDVPSSLVYFFINFDYSTAVSNSYLENITTDKSYNFKIGTPSVNYFGYDGLIVVPAIQQNGFDLWPGYTEDYGVFTFIAYSQGRPVNPLDGLYQPAFAWEDGIWHLSTRLQTDIGDYESDAYYLLTEQLDCCMTKYAAKIASGCTAKALDKMTDMLTYRDMAYKAFEEGDYATTNLMLKKANELCSQTGCNCGCN